jgi:aspartate-semialdehyde dehydrogenase
MSTSGGRTPRRLVLFGVTGQVGQEVLEVLEEEEAPVADLVGVASPDSAGRTFYFAGQERDVEIDWPALKGRDLVIVCTRGPAALEIVRESLHAQVPCLDLTGALAAQTGAAVPTPFASDLENDADEALRTAPLLSAPSATALAWAPLLDVFAASPGLARVRGTVLASAAAHGRPGVVALSEESIALFNQSAGPDPGPAGQAVAFDVLPGGSVDTDRVRSELARKFGAELGLDVASMQVPTFVGEGSWLSFELAAPLERSEVEARLEKAPGLDFVASGPGARGLAAVDPDGPEPLGPTLRDAAGMDGVLAGRLEADQALAEGLGWRVWLACDPLRLVAAHALRMAGRRLGWS